MKLTYTGIVTKVNKKTAAKGFKHTQVGDEIKLAWNLGGGYHGAPCVDCYLNGDYVDTKNADTVKYLFKIGKPKWNGESHKYEPQPPNFTLEEVTK